MQEAHLGNTPAGAGPAPSTTARALVSLRHVDKRFANGMLALQDMTLDIGAHDFISLLGPSGCGKSTALRLMAGLARSSGGSMHWSGAEQAPSGRELGFVFQEPTLMPWAKVFDNVWLPLQLAGVRRAVAAPVVRQALEMVGLSRFADVYPRELSGGMKMRVSIARALATRPRLLLMDEPFAALDEMTRIKLNDDLLAIWREHRFSVVFVTHSVYESVYLSNRIVVMAARPGRVIDELHIDEPYPRGADWRSAARYHAHCTAVSQSLRGALYGLGIDH